MNMFFFFFSGDCSSSLCGAQCIVIFGNTNHCSAGYRHRHYPPVKIHFKFQISIISYYSTSTLTIHIKLLYEFDGKLSIPTSKTWQSAPQKVTIEADQYTEEHPNGLCAMLFCRVCLGRIINQSEGTVQATKPTGWRHTMPYLTQTHCLLCL